MVMVFRCGDKGLSKRSASALIIVKIIGEVSMIVLKADFLHVVIATRKKYAFG